MHRIQSVVGGVFSIKSYLFGTVEAFDGEWGTVYLQRQHHGFDKDGRQGIQSTLLQIYLVLFFHSKRLQPPPMITFQTVIKLKLQSSNGETHYRCYTGESPRHPGKIKDPQSSTNNEAFIYRDICLNRAEPLFETRDKQLGMDPLFVIDARHHGKGPVIFSWNPHGTLLASSGSNRTVHIFTCHGQLVHSIKSPSSR